MPKRGKKAGKGRAKAAPKRARTSRAGTKALEALRRTQQINEVIQRGGIENQALQFSGVESRPEEETHISALLESKEQPSTPNKKKGKKSK